MRQTVAIIGLGAMGTALARAQLAAGHTTTVWNRTASRADALVTQGAASAKTGADAAKNADIVLVCVTTCDAAIAALDGAWGPGALAGRIVVQLGTTTPAESRAFADKVRAAGGVPLDGAIKFYPDTVGPETDEPILVAGDRVAYQTALPVLRQLSSNLKYMGDNIAAPAALDLAVLTLSVALYAGAAHAARLSEAEGLDLETLADSTNHGPRVPERIRIMARNAFALNTLYDGASVEVWSGVVQRLREQARAAGIDSALPDFLGTFYSQAEAQGFGAEDVAALVKPLRAKDQSP